jgi:hypothetical protein
VEEVDHLRKVIVMEDKQLSLRVEIPIGDKPLKEVSIVCPSWPTTIIESTVDLLIGSKTVLNGESESGLAEKNWLRKLGQCLIASDSSSIFIS